MLVFHASALDPPPINEAYLDGGDVLGDPVVMDLVFNLKTDVAQSSPTLVTLDKMLGVSAEADELAAKLENGLFITSLETGGEGK